LDNDRKAFEEREKSRKAKLGAAFMMAGEDDDDDEDRKAPVVEKKRDRESELSFAFERPTPLSQAVERSLRGMPASSIAGVASQTAGLVSSAGSQGLLGDAFKILQDATTTGRMGAPLPQRGRSRSRQRDNRPNGRSYRSPTPDGKARGQARAARKAKLIASMMGLDLPRT